MALSHVLLPPGVGGDVVYGCTPPRPNGVCFRLRLAFRDETSDPPSAGEFDHEWVVSPLELTQAEQEGTSDLVLLRRRAREQRQFLRIVQRVLRHEGVRLERIGRHLVLRRVDR